MPGFLSISNLCNCRHFTHSFVRLILVFIDDNCKRNDFLIAKS
ncbi:hypothetical protein HMPREF9444_01754 [Succinatimonas hippei YIT 12066]|uniref:Uncharacterized protein n=1 Tax=Succinatimonas hippei (strain DSM 22608 / JCM 16073 / KCTC 15190 / YIT 12066) TaxID=762983 RepID=E8LLY1_SUCHY|nr:hypothetical protein HMPREF9444_01754 [Succinatimonas hippei YIT 12066]